MTDFGDRYYSYSRYMKETLGHQFYPVPINLKLGCPNRAEDHSGGCTFCPIHGARARQIMNAESVEEQIDQAMRFARQRYGAKHFMAYIQAYTGTFAPATEQRKIYDHIMSIFPFEALSIGTRPDCLQDDSLDFIKEMQERLDVRVELGIQTTHDRTLRKINRGHDWACGREGILKLRERDIPVIAHVILGLPGESNEDFNITAERLAELPLTGLKIHNLHVLNNSPMAKSYLRSPFHVMDEYEYLDVLIEFLRRLPPTLPILRVTADSGDEELIAPKWSMSKGQFLEQLNRHLYFRRYSQGDLYTVKSGPQRPGLSPDTPISKLESDSPSVNMPITTDDGSFTYWSPVFKEHYHTTVGAEAEAVKKYIEPSDIRKALPHKRLRILDVCFGLGYNSLAAISLLDDHPGAPGLDIVGLELDRGVVIDAATSSTGKRKEILISLAESAAYVGDRVNIDILWGDARHTVKRAAQAGQFDYIYLDAFSTQKNTELWTVEFFRELYALLAPNGRLLTYCAALPARSGMIEAGFHVGNTPAFGRERAGTIACRNPALLEHPLDDQERQNLRSTTKGIPYHDPHGTDSSREILKRREEVVRKFKRQQAPQH